jgi:hypothetical protein
VCADVGWIHLAQDFENCRPLVNTVINLPRSIRGRNYFDHLKPRCVLKMGFCVFSRLQEFDVLTVVTMKSTTFWDVIDVSLPTFRGKILPSNQQEYLLRSLLLPIGCLLMLLSCLNGGVCISETSVNLHGTTRHSITDDNIVACRPVARQRPRNKQRVQQ